MIHQIPSKDFSDAEQHKCAGMPDRVKVWLDDRTLPACWWSNCTRTGEVLISGKWEPVLQFGDIDLPLPHQVRCPWCRERLP